MEHIQNSVETTLWWNDLSTNISFQAKTVWKTLRGICRQCCIFNSVKLHFAGTLLQVTSGITKLEVFENLCGEWGGKWHILDTVRKYRGQSIFQLARVTKLEVFVNLGAAYADSAVHSTLWKKSTLDEASFVNMRFQKVKAVWQATHELHGKCHIRNSVKQRSEETILHLTSGFKLCLSANAGLEE